MEEKIVLIPRMLGLLNLKCAVDIVKSMGGECRGLFPNNDMWRALGFVYCLKARPCDFEALADLGIHELI